MKPVGPLENEPYEEIYGGIDYTDKIILEFGADSGSTAYFFLQHGAKRVIGIEGHIDWFKSFVDVLSGPGPKQYPTNKEPRVIPIYMWIENAKQWSMLIKAWQPDIVHADIEGGKNN